jgi:hypothetical protein
VAAKAFHNKKGEIKKGPGYVGKYPRKYGLKNGTNVPPF